MSRRRAVARSVLPVLLLVGTGCTGPGLFGTVKTSGVEVHSVVPPSERRESAPEQLAVLSSMSPVEVRAALPQAWNAYADSGSAHDRLWVVLLTVRAQAGVEDDRRALKLLEAAPSRSVASPATDFEGLEALLHFFLTERVRAAEHMASTRAEVETAREELRALDASLGGDQARFQDLEAQLQDERKRTEILTRRVGQAERRVVEAEARLQEEAKKRSALERQIEQLKTIERIIDRREEPRTEGPQ